LGYRKPVFLKESIQNNLRWHQPTWLIIPTHTGNFMKANELDYATNYGWVNTDTIDISNLEVK
jgi:hypothetical protein